MMNEGFGKKWIDKILGKVDKDQGVANAGKVLGIGNDGQVVPVAQSGGGSAFTPYVESSTWGNLATKIKNGEVKIGDVIYGTVYLPCPYESTPETTNIGTADSPLYRVKFRSSSVGNARVRFNLTVSSYDASTSIVNFAIESIPVIIQTSSNVQVGESSFTLYYIRNHTITISSLNTDTMNLTYDVYTIFQLISSITGSYPVLGENCMNYDLSQPYKIPSSTECAIIHMS